MKGFGLVIRLEEGIIEDYGNKSWEGIKLFEKINYAGRQVVELCNQTTGRGRLLAL